MVNIINFKFWIYSCVQCPPFSKKQQKQPPEVFCKQRCSRSFAKFTGKHLYLSLSFNKVACLGLYEKRDSSKFIRRPFLQNTSGRVLLQKNVFDRQKHIHTQSLLN